MITTSQPEIRRGIRGQQFRDKISSILKFGNISEKYIKELLTEESMKEYDRAFTSSTVDTNFNYEVYEQKGDVIANCFIVWYSYKRFPQLKCTEGVQIVALLKIKYGSKNSFAKIAQELEFDKYISVTNEKYMKDRKSLLEDCLESFCGVTVELLDDKFMIGVGYSIIYDILSTIFDKFVHISLEYEDLKDPKTILKEIIDKDKRNSPDKRFFADNNPSYRKVGYDQDTKLVIIDVFINIYDKNGQKKEIKIGQGKGAKADIAEQAASKDALDKFMKSNKLYTGAPDFWKNMCITK